MSCEIIATQDGVACAGETVDRISRYVAALEFSYGPLSTCRVVIETRHKHHAFGQSVFVYVEILPVGRMDFVPSSYAVQDKMITALDAAFASALARGRRGIPVPGARLLQTKSGHIIRLSPDRTAGALKTEDGDTVEFALSGAEQGLAMPFRIGDRAWLTPATEDDRPRMLVCARRGRVLPVQLKTVA